MSDLIIACNTEPNFSPVRKHVQPIGVLEGSMACGYMNLGRGNLDIKELGQHGVLSWSHNLAKLNLKYHMNYL